MYVRLAAIFAFAIPSPWYLSLFQNEFWNKLN
jgi:hypothetical protein